ncbi:MAG: glutathione S-transferase family protein [Gammaproteobacteria bacterium]|nr:glutathione S-transferase family protein [Gammaproteobacteria bacterium]
MKLYGHPWSSNSRRVQLLCEELKIPYSHETVDLMKGAQYTPEFQALNPNAKVPVIDDDGFVLWESQAIMRYLADKHKANTWYPTEPKARAVVEQWLDWNQTRLGPEAGKIMYNTHFAGDKRNDQAIEDAKKWLEKILPVMDGALAKRPYLCGAAITLADLAVATNVAYLDHCRYDLAPYPAIRRWFDALKARPSFAKTAPKM